MAQPGRPKGIPQSPAEKAAASRNLKAYREKDPAGPALKHGAQSAIVRQRYSDKRTTEGRALADVMTQVEADLGGPSELTAGMRIILGNVRSKLIILWQLGDYLDRQASIVNEAQDTLPCLKMYMTTSESLRKDLSELSSMSRAADKQSKAPSLSEYLKLKEQNPS